MSKTWKDPVTGDELTRGEYVSWQIQGIFRRWTVLCIILVVTAMCWSTFNSFVLSWWNLSASLLAIIIEFIVGLAMLGQTKRDALVLREIRTLAQQIEKQDEAMLNLLTRMEAQEAMLINVTGHLEGR